MGLFGSSSSTSQVPSRTIKPSKPAATTSTTHPSKPAPQAWSFPVPKFEPLVYLPRSHKEAILELPVFRLLVVAHYLLGDDGQASSVRVDPNPSGIPGTQIKGGSKANIAVSKLPYQCTNQQQHVCILQTRKGVKVRHFIEAIVSHGRQKYEFNEAGRGCRGWTSQQIDLFLQTKLITSEKEAKKAQQDMTLEYDDQKPTGRKLHWDVGAYYT